MDLLRTKIPPNLYDSLFKAHITSLQTILVTPKLSLAQQTNLDLKSVDNIVIETSKILLTDKITIASKIPKPLYISVGCQSIDSVTRGGLSVGGINEIVGCSGVGKTQLCLQLSIRTQLPCNSGGLGKSVIYLCTEDVFPSKRFNELANYYKLEHNIPFEDNVFINHIADAEQLRQCSNNLPKILAVKQIGLLVIDSIAGIFRGENSDVNYVSRSQELVSIAIKLHKLSSTYGFVIVCVNQVTDNPETGTTDACLGLTWSNLVTRRFTITRFNQSPVRQFEAVFAPDLPQRKCQFKIGREGLTSCET